MAGGALAGVMDVDETGMAAELAARRRWPGPRRRPKAPTWCTAPTRPASPQIDADLAKMVDNLQLATDRPKVDDAEVYQDTVRHRAGRSSGRSSGTSSPRSPWSFVLAICQIAPDLVFGQVSNLVGDENNTNLPAAELAALGLAFVGVLTGFVARYFRIEAQKLAQSIILTLRRRVFRRLTKLGRELLRP